jgi:hypothetical protein
MATINSIEMVEDIIANNGYYEGDPRVVRIVRYNNQFNGAKAYGLIYAGDDPDRYHKSPACINPETIWDAT